MCSSSSVSILRVRSFVVSVALPEKLHSRACTFCTRSHAARDQRTRKGTKRNGFTSDRLSRSIIADSRSLARSPVPPPDASPDTTSSLEHPRGETMTRVTPVFRQRCDFFRPPGKIPRQLFFRDSSRLLFRRSPCSRNNEGTCMPDVGHAKKKCKKRLKKIHIWTTSVLENIHLYLFVDIYFARLSAALSTSFLL